MYSLVNGMRALNNNGTVKILDGQELVSYAKSRHFHQEFYHNIIWFHFKKVSFHLYWNRCFDHIPSTFFAQLFSCPLDHLYSIFLPLIAQSLPHPVFPPFLLPSSVPFPQSSTIDLAKSIIYKMQHFDKVITAFTLNYSGILDSPYEFYSNQLEKQERALSEIFHSLLTALPHYDVATFKWDIGKIDQLYQRQRYAPIYNKTDGVHEGQLVTRETFERLWEEKFVKVPQGQITPQHRRNMKLFDYLTYCTLVIHSNSLKALEEIPFQACSAEKYMALQERFHQKSFINQQKKRVKTLSVLQKRQVDVIFLQECNEDFKKAVLECGQYHLITNKDIQSAILIRKESFRAYKPQTELGFKTSNWNNDTIWCKIGRLVLISAHLSSKKEKNEKQVAAFMKDLHQFKTTYPELHVLVGIDANSFIQSKNQHVFHIFPCKQEVATTNKERTWLQAQVNKANVVARSCKDHLISDLSLLKSEVTLINGFNLNILLPTEMHPYDHYIVAAQVHTQL